MEIVLTRWIFFAGEIGRILMSSIESFAFAARVFWMALRCALVVLIANPRVLKFFG